MTQTTCIQAHWTWPAVLLLSLMQSCLPSPPGSKADAAKTENIVALDGGCVALGWSCAQVGNCASACGNDQGCVNACSSQGCASARDAFAQVQSCTIDHCLLTCAAGSGPDCDACSAEHCAPEQASCDADRCPVQCGADAAPQDVGSVEEGGPALACMQVLNCFGGCRVETPRLCTDPCRQQSCPGAALALDALLSCADQNCKNLVEDRRCFVSYASGDCRQCMQEKCSSEWDVCLGALCP